ncbi:MAG: hypothetical protein HRT65_01545 [Flavobacteriaceae bacterium]|nr:hypothetical protein [Flavobacteriaceae bacterium]
MKKVCSFLAALAIVAVGNAQTSGQVVSYNANSADGGVSDALYKYAMGSIEDSEAKATYLDENIEGSPYMANEFKLTQIYYGDEKAGDMYYRYNAHNEEIELKQQNVEEEPIRALGRDKKINLVVDGKRMAFKTFIDRNGKTQNGYLTLLSDGKYKLYKRLKITFKEAKKAPNTFVKASPARFTKFTEYYIEVDGGNRIDEVQLSNKKLLNLVEGDMQSELKSFLKENRIKVSDEGDIHKVVQFLNS